MLTHTTGGENQVRPRRARMVTRYGRWLAASTAVFLCFVALVDLAFTIASNFRELERSQNAHVAYSVDRINQYLSGLATLLRDSADIPWSSAGFDDTDRLNELHRLLKLAPEFRELRLVDPDRARFVSVSREGPDSVGLIPLLRIEEQSPNNPALQLAQPPRKGFSIGATQLVDGNRPFVTMLASPTAEARASITVLVDLYFVNKVIVAANTLQDGTVYLFDEGGNLLAHPSSVEVLKSRPLSQRPNITAAAESAATTGKTIQHLGLGLDGALSYMSISAVPATKWFIAYEQPVLTAFGPTVFDSLKSALVILVGLVAAWFLGMWLAKRIAQPVLELEYAARSVAAGDLSARVRFKSSDEMQSLGDQFNNMASQLEQYTESLEESVKSRTSELSIALAELETKRADADRANTAKTRFLAAASHDLRQPMHAISLLVGILDERIHEAELRPLVEKVQMSVSAMESLFDGLLDISKLDAGIVKPNVCQFDLNSLLQVVEVNFAPLAKERGLTIRVVPTRAIIETDPALLERIVNNLVVNALNYTPRGHVLIGCRRRGDRLLILVIDTGIGIADESRGRIFDEFFQVANIERERSKGLGLGLSIVKRLSELLGHSLVVRSVLGKGSSFGVEVPYIGATRNRLESEKDDSPRRDEIRRKFIAVIDDDPESRFATEAICLHWGCHVVSGASSESALKQLSQHLRMPDLILCDYRLQDGETGLDAIDRLRAKFETCIPSILVTGDSIVLAPELLGNRERLAVLQKPASADAILAAAMRVSA